MVLHPTGTYPVTDPVRSLAPLEIQSMPSMMLIVMFFRNRSNHLERDSNANIIDFEFIEFSNKKDIPMFAPTYRTKADFEANCIKILIVSGSKA